jgi:hypothetical protein
MKIYFTLGLFFIAFLRSEAQVKIGVKTGYNLSTLQYSGVLYLNNKSNLSGFNAGILVSIPLSSYFSLQPEIVYSAQGTNYQIANADAAYHYNYLNIPILLKYQHPIGLFAETGVQISFPLSAKNIVAGKSEDIMSKTYSPDYAWVSGLGYKVPKINLSIDIRYNLGLINIAHQDAGDVNIKNSVFQIGLFYLF